MSVQTGKDSEEKMKRKALSEHEAAIFRRMRGAIRHLMFNILLRHAKLSFLRDVRDTDQSGLHECKLVESTHPPLINCHLHHNIGAQTFMDTLLGRSGLRGILFNEPSDVSAHPPSNEQRRLSVPQPVSGSANRRIRTVSASIQLHVHKEVHTATDNDESDRASVIKISKV